MLQSGDKAGIQEARVWQQNAAAWTEGLFRQFPLYRDILQPVVLGVYEARYGLSMLLSQAECRAQDVGQKFELAAALVADAMAFPSRVQQGKSLFLQSGTPPEMHCLLTLVLSC